MAKKSVILMADRMVNAGMLYGSEARTPKIFNFDKFGIGFAGTLTDIICIKDHLENKSSLPEFINHISETIKTENERRKSLLTAKYIGMSYDRFKEFLEKMEERFQMI